jgi:hypothetical protein
MWVTGIHVRAETYPVRETSEITENANHSGTQ